MVINSNPSVSAGYTVRHDFLDVDVELVRDAVDHVDTDYPDPKTGRGHLKNKIS